MINEQRNALREMRLAQAANLVKAFPTPTLPEGFTAAVFIDSTDEWLADGRVFLIRLTYSSPSRKSYNQEWRCQIGCEQYDEFQNFSMRIYDEFASAVKKLRRRAGVLA